MFVDSHAHLDSPDFKADLEEILKRAAQAGVTRILAIACVKEDLEADTRILDLAETHESIFVAAGVHPHDAQFYSETLGTRILQLMNHRKVLGWGEIGLDFYYDNSPRDEQRDAFRSQLRLAAAAGKPVIIHSRNAEEETCEILEHEFSQGPGGILHCFTHSMKTAECCLPFGFYVSFGGILTFPKAEEIRDIARELPMGRLLIETDAPYLAPIPYRGRRNEPAYVVKVAEKLAEIRGMTVEEIGTQTSRNFEELFGV